MTNPTSNYSWQMPTSTDLVTDLPADFAVFGQAVDTTTKALNPSTTLGDIEYRSATANTNTRLAIGTTGQVLSVVGGVPAWATVSSGGMTLLSTTTLSGTSTIVSSISQSYKSLFIRIYGSTNDTNDRNIYIDTNSTNNIAYVYNQDGATSNTNQNYIRTYSTFARADANNGFNLMIDRYTSTGYKPFQFYGAYMGTGGTRRQIQAAGADWQTSAITSIRVTKDGENMTGGTIEIFGVN